MREQQNVSDVVALGVTMVGFIFYPRSPRFVSDIAPVTPSDVARVGVFVDESEPRIREIATLNNLTHLQLHGNESPSLCQSLGKNWTIIKAISVSGAEDFARCEPYHGVCDLLLFDTKCSGYGGSGERFDWSLLDSYKGDTPFLLSGGISPQDSSSIAQITHPRLVGIDLNSRFESKAAHKNIELLKQFIDEQNR